MLGFISVQCVTSIIVVYIATDSDTQSLFQMPQVVGTRDTLAICPCPENSRSEELSLSSMFKKVRWPGAATVAQTLISQKVLIGWLNMPGCDFRIWLSPGACSILF